tara:strand:+ start:6472 stop:7047 length:576 start_codon:yes stop_codon:yes gene_type:complete
MTGNISEAEFMNQQQQQQIANDPNAMYADAMKEEKVTNILQQINPDNLLADIEHRIRGEKKDFTGEWVPISKTAETVSDELISDFISFLGSILNQNTSMSNFSPPEINNLMELIRNWVMNHLVVNAERYEIEGRYSEYDRIGHIICSTCFTVLKRAQNGQESRRIFKIMRLTESSNMGKNKGGFVDNFKFW